MTVVTEYLEIWALSHFHDLLCRGWEGMVKRPRVRHNDRALPPAHCLPGGACASGTVGPQAGRPWPRLEVAPPHVDALSGKFNVGSEAASRLASKLLLTHAVNGHAVKGYAVDGASLKACRNGNAVNGNTVSGHAVNGNAVKGIAVIGNAVNGNASAVSGNAQTATSLALSALGTISLSPAASLETLRARRPLQVSASAIAGPRVGWPWPRLGATLTRPLMPHGPLLCPCGQGLSVMAKVWRPSHTAQLVIGL